VNLDLIERIAPELRDALLGATFRNTFQLGATRFALAFEGDEFRLLFISIEPSDPRLYLIRRRLRDLKKQSTHPSQFAIALEKALIGIPVNALDQIGEDRIIEIRFSEHRLVVQLTGKSSNMFLLDSERRITAAARNPKGEGQMIGEHYETPERREPEARDENWADLISASADAALSETLDHYFQSFDERRNFEALAAAVKHKNRQEVAKVTRLVKNLNSDLEEHGDAEKWKRFGDLLLANQNAAERRSGVIRVKDLFDAKAPVIDIEADENDSMSQTAQKYFRRYTKARNAKASIESRLKDLQIELRRLEEVRKAIEKAVRDGDREFLNNLVEKKKPGQKPDKKRRESVIPSGIRTFLSSDGFEILVGKKATDNDFLTSRIANSRDMWMHAADYPGSHVVIRNANQKEIPHRTLIEAAQLAAFYSQGKKQPKAAIHYTQKKFVNKPKGAAPGLVRLASFKTILVEPKIGNVKSIIR
jgi:predicted ribosome quality control (RQC) complex YloA/Tae2 family protein